MGRLDALLGAATRDLERRKAAKPEAELIAELELAERDPRPFREALSRAGLSVIAEFKRRSPSAGAINADADPAQIAGAYERAGAAALSVLTDRQNFDGSIEDLVAARTAVSLPVLRKDFIVEDYQLFESALAGADAVLLIVAALSDSRLARLHENARALDLDCLVEVHTAEDLERALEVEPDLVGINNRNLRDLSVDTGRTRELITDIPAGKFVVAESGYSTRDDLDELAELGADAVLIGEALMSDPDPEGALRALLVDEDPTSEHRIIS